MSKIGLIIAVLSLLGCEPGSEGRFMDQRSLEDISANLLGRRFGTVEDLKRYLKQNDIDYTLSEEDDPSLIIAPSTCQLDRNSKFFFLRIEGTRGPKIYRYRIYAVGAEALCIEQDFGFKNPYQ